MLLLGVAVVRPTTAGETGPPRMITARSTVLYGQAGARLVAVEQIPSLAELELRTGTSVLVDRAGAIYRPVLRTDGGVRQTRWIRAADVVPLPESASSTAELPPLIAKQPPALQRAWTDVEALIRENQTLPAPLPQPFLARAEIWAQASNYEEAIKDMLTASRLARQRGASLAEQSKMMGRVQQLLEQLAQTPRPRYFGDADSHYRAGFEAYHQGQLETALRHFDSAVQLAPEDKVNWYYRALTHKRLHDDASAERDITIAVYQERRVPGEPPKWWLDQFIRVQGPLRNWMESYRSGTPLVR